MKLDVIFNLPNIIGYIRIILLIIGSNKSKGFFLFTYCISSALDFFDGFLARKYNQSSVLGKCLDMFTDRVSTIVISFRILKEKIDLYKFLCLYVMTDVFSHMFHFYLSALKNSSHKEEVNSILKIYYFKPFLFSICFLSECFFIYTLSGIKKGYLYIALYYSALIKMGFHVVQLVDAIAKISDYNEKAL